MEAEADLFEAVAGFFVAEHWPVQLMAQEGTIKTGFRGHNGQWNCLGTVFAHLEQFVFYSMAPIKVPDERRLAVAEFITRANHGLHVGNFELDFASGDVAYKTSIDVEGDRLSEALVRQLVMANVSTMDRYLPGLKEVVAEVDPAVAIADIEG